MSSSLHLSVLWVGAASVPPYSGVGWSASAPESASLDLVVLSWPCRRFISGDPVPQTSVLGLYSFLRVFAELKYFRLPTRLNQKTEPEAGLIVATKGRLAIKPFQSSFSSP